MLCKFKYIIINICMLIYIKITMLTTENRILKKVEQLNLSNIELKQIIIENDRKNYIRHGMVYKKAYKDSAILVDAMNNGIEVLGII